MTAYRLPILLLLAAALGLAGCEERVRLERGDPAPAFALKDIEGTTRNFPGDFRGTPVVVRFWADWCRFCKQEMREVEAVYREHGGEAFTVLAINVGQDRDTARDFVTRLGVTYDTLLDTESTVAGTYGVVGLPTTFFVDREGRIRAKILGEADKATFERMLAETL